MDIRLINYPVYQYRVSVYEGQRYMGNSWRKYENSRFLEAHSRGFCPMFILMFKVFRCNQQSLFLDVQEGKEKRTGELRSFWLQVDGKCRTREGSCTVSKLCEWSDTWSSRMGLIRDSFFCDLEMSDVELAVERNECECWVGVILLTVSLWKLLSRALLISYPTGWALEACMWAHMSEGCNR